MESKLIEKSLTDFMIVFLPTKDVINFGRSCKALCHTINKKWESYACDRYHFKFLCVDGEANAVSVYMLERELKKIPKLPYSYLDICKMESKVITSIYHCVWLAKYKFEIYHLWDLLTMIHEIVDNTYKFNFMSLIIHLKDKNALLTITNYTGTKYPYISLEYAIANLLINYYSIDWPRKNKKILTAEQITNLRREIKILLEVYNFTRNVNNSYDQRYEMSKCESQRKIVQVLANIICHINLRNNTRNNYFLRDLAKVRDQRKYSFLT